MTRSRHPSQHIERAVRYAENLGWRVVLSNGSCVGTTVLPERHQGRLHHQRVVHAAMPGEPRSAHSHQSGFLPAPRRMRTRGRGKQRHMNETQACEREYDFALVLKGVHHLTTEVEDALFQAGCDDATLSLQYGSVAMEFSRSALTLKDAILSAIRDVRKAGIGADVWRVDACELVSPAEIARRIKRSRQLVHQYMTGKRGPGGFPAPECNLTDGQPLWSWCAVSYWLSQNDMIRLEELRDAEIVAAINNALERAHQHQRNPALVDEVSRAVAQA